MQKQPTDEERRHLIDLAMAMSQYLIDGDVKTATSYAHKFNKVAHCRHENGQRTLDGARCLDCGYTTRGH